MQIRVATESDIEAIQQVARDAWEAAYLDVIGQREVDAAMDEWYSRKYLERVLADEKVGYFVAVDDEMGASDPAGSGESGGTVVGYASCGPTNEIGIGALSSIYVRPERWGEGIGERLLDRVARDLDDRGMARIRAVVIGGNEVGNAFYRAHGFERVEEREADLLAGKTVEEYVYYRNVR